MKFSNDMKKLMNGKLLFFNNISITQLYKLLKNTKTRTGNNTEKCNEEDIQKVIKEAEDIKFNNPDVIIKKINCLD